MKEIETKILEVSLEDIQSRIDNCNQFLLMERNDEVYTTLFFDKDEDNEYVQLKEQGIIFRLRDEGGSAWLVAKDKPKIIDGVRSCEEISVWVGDFQDCVKLLELIGFNVQSENKKRRVTWSFRYKGLATMGGEVVEIVHDTYLADYSYIKPFIEIEAPNQEILIEVAELLGYNKDQFCELTLFGLMEKYKD